MAVSRSRSWSDACRMDASTAARRACSRRSMASRSSQQASSDAVSARENPRHRRAVMRLAVSSWAAAYRR